MSPEITENIVNKAKITKGFYKNWANASANVCEADQADHPLTIDEFDFYESARAKHTHTHTEEKTRHGNKT